MFRFLMLSIWIAGAWFLVKSYVSGLSEMAVNKADATKAMADLALGGPFAGFKDMGDMVLWFHIAMIVSFVLYAIFTKQVMKEFGPNAK